MDEGERPGLPPVTNEEEWRRRIDYWRSRIGELVDEMMADLNPDVLLAAFGDEYTDYDSEELQAFREARASGWLLAIERTTLDEEHAFGSYFPGLMQPSSRSLGIAQRALDYYR